jgi:hypothetical protein
MAVNLHHDSPLFTEHDGKTPDQASTGHFTDDNRHLFLHNSNGTIYVLRLDDSRKR